MKQYKGLSEAQKNWLKLACKKEQNPYMQAKLLYQLLGDGKP